MGYIGSMIGAKEEINFTGKKMDLKTGLYYFNQRYYDPELGRFLQEDPAAQGPNLYQYCSNNPLIYVDKDGRFWNFIIKFAVDFVVAAAVEGAKSAAINATFQYATTGRVNMNTVGNAFVSGGIAGGFNVGGGIVTPGGGDVFSYALAGGINNALTNVAVKWATGKGGDVFQQLKDGFGVGALSGMAKWGFKELVGYNPSMKSGSKVAGLDGNPQKKVLGVNTVEGANNIGIERGGDGPEFMTSWFMEGGDASNIMNFFPGMNALSEIHDQWVSKRHYGFVGSLVSAILSPIPTYLVMYPEMSYYYAH